MGDKTQVVWICDHVASDGGGFHAVAQSRDAAMVWLEERRARALRGAESMNEHYRQRGSDETWTVGAIEAREDGGFAFSDELDTFRIRPEEFLESRAQPVEGER